MEQMKDERAQMPECLLCLADVSGCCILFPPSLLFAVCIMRQMGLKKFEASRPGWRVREGEGLYVRMEGYWLEPNKLGYPEPIMMSSDLICAGKIGLS